MTEIGKIKRDTKPKGNTLKDEKKDKITAEIKGFGSYTDIPKNALKRGLKTNSYISRMNVEVLSC